MTGQIPPYGKHFRLEQVPGYHPELAHRAYVLKADSEWFIRSDRTSEHWQVFRGTGRDDADPHGRAQPTLTRAMALLLTGIGQGYYVTTGQPSS
jgi:hypothetical protein